jgi:hypothetical protein
LKSARIGLPPPSGTTSFSSSKRSNLAWTVTGMSPISSRNSVPPSAASTLPRIPLLRAPVNAPGHSRIIRFRSSFPGLHRN